MKISFDGAPRELIEFFRATADSGNSDFWRMFFTGVVGDFANGYSRPSKGHGKENMKHQD